MAGKITDGTIENPDGREAKAFCEGRFARALAAVPTNPHTVGTPESDAWLRGVASKLAAEGDGPCCHTGAAAV